MLQTQYLNQLCNFINQKPIFPNFFFFFFPLSSISIPKNYQHSTSQVPTPRAKVLRFFPIAPHRPLQPYPSSFNVLPVAAEKASLSHRTSLSHTTTRFEFFCLNPPPAINHRKHVGKQVPRGGGRRAVHDFLSQLLSQQKKKKRFNADAAGLPCKLRSLSEEKQPPRFLCPALLCCG